MTKNEDPKKNQKNSKQKLNRRNHLKNLASNKVKTRGEHLLRKIEQSKLIRCGFD